MATGTDTDNALLSLSDALSYLGLGVSTDSTGNNDTVRDVINSVSWRFNAETGRNLKARDYTSQYDGDGSDELWLKNWPMASTTLTITINSNRDFTDTDDAVTSTDVMLDTGTAQIRLDTNSFNSGTQNVQVEYTAGYSTSGAFDLTYAAKEFLQILYDRQTDRTPLEVRTEAYEGVSRTFELEFPWSVRKVLDMYKERSY